METKSDGNINLANYTNWRSNGLSSSSSSSSSLWLQVQKYYQPRKSRRSLTIILRGEKVPLYGAGAGMSLSSNGGAVPLTLDFDIISRGYVIGKLVRVKHLKHVSCPLVVDSSKNKPIKFAQDACTYFWDVLTLLHCGACWNRSICRHQNERKRELFIHAVMVLVIVFACVR